MNFALTLFWIVTGLSFAVGTVLTLIGLLRAPEGFEDETGFPIPSRCRGSQKR